MNEYLRNKCMVNDLNIGACNSSSCKMTKKRARERHWVSVQLVSLVHVLSIARCCRLYQLTLSCSCQCSCQHTNCFLLEMWHHCPKTYIASTIPWNKIYYAQV